MDIKNKVERALKRYLRPQVIHLVNEEGISGYVVSAHFQKKPSLERQTIIYNVLRGSSARLSESELRQVLAIAALTPAEYQALGYDERDA